MLFKWGWVGVSLAIAQRNLQRTITRPQSVFQDDDEYSDFDASWNEIQEIVKADALDANTSTARPLAASTIAPLELTFPAPRPGGRVRFPPPAAQPTPIPAGNSGDVLDSPKRRADPTGPLPPPGPLAPPPQTPVPVPFRPLAENTFRPSPKPTPPPAAPQTFQDYRHAVDFIANALPLDNNSTENPSGHLLASMIVFRLMNSRDGTTAFDGKMIESLLRGLEVAVPELRVLATLRERLSWKDHLSHHEEKQAIELSGRCLLAATRRFFVTVDGDKSVPLSAMAAVIAALQSFSQADFRDPLDPNPVTQPPLKPRLFRNPVAVPERSSDWNVVLSRTAGPDLPTMEFEILPELRRTTTAPEHRFRKYIKSHLPRIHHRRHHEPKTWEEEDRMVEAELGELLDNLETRLRDRLNLRVY